MRLCYYDHGSSFWKARITLARAVYSSAQILLLDDVSPERLPGISCDSRVV